MFFTLVASLLASTTLGCGWSPPVAVVPADLAETLMRFERAYEMTPPSSATLKEVNLQFDKSTLAYFTFNFNEVMRGLDAILQGTMATKSASDSAKVAASLKARVTPRVFVKGTSDSVSARISSCYELAFPESRTFSIKLRLTPISGGASIVETTINAPVGPSTRVDTTISSMLNAEKTLPRSYYIDLVATDGAVYHAGRWSVVTRELAPLREANAARLGTITSDAPAINQAVAVCKARNELLTDTPSEQRLIEYLSDPAAMSAQVESEIAALEQGTDPYSRRRGDYWRIFKTDTTQIPARIYVPTTLNLDKPAALVVALHGAGGDENMFPDGYGAGKIKALADQYGFILISPLTYPLLGNPMLFDKMLTLISYDYPIDTSRVYVIGHSMGAVAAGRLCVERRSLITAGVCMAGAGDLSTAEELPPMRVYGAEVDQIVRTARVKEEATTAKEKGLPVEYRELADYGHTLMVQGALPEAVEWLFSRTGAKKR